MDLPSPYQLFVSLCRNIEGGTPRVEPDIILVLRLQDLLYVLN
jgi:hypothetical protein